MVGEHISIRTMLIKQQLSINTHLSAWLKQKTAATPNAGKDVEKLDHSYIAEGNVKWQPLLYKTG